MISLNQVIIIGNLVGDVEVRHGKQSGIAYTRFTLASNSPRNSRGQSRTNYASCVAFAKNADSLGQVGHQGNLIYVNGHIRTDKYTNKAGKNIYTMNVQVDSFEKITSNTPSNTKSHQPATSFDQASPDDHKSDSAPSNSNRPPKSSQQSYDNTNGSASHHSADDNETGRDIKQKLENGSKDINISNDKLPF